ncbi:putative E3 ubiquitin-protein ligase ARI7 [Glarea lozoyensis 74030]|uniref:RBR-type E3 ubiquitin transferase n=1 Tax=Glarea lozoyensis (strain ATCC 74030 / MF5533) TaxID=1104152 RepID=H0EW17_GLAL7|nr:putative E3 ubiquitin-protein ligase ARI7 [Glarea lozoyensis 74030]
MLDEHMSKTSSEPSPNGHGQDQDMESGNMSDGEWPEYRPADFESSNQYPGPNNHSQIVNPGVSSNELADAQREIDAEPTIINTNEPQQENPRQAPLEGNSSGGSRARPRPVLRHARTPRDRFNGLRAYSEQSTESEEESNSDSEVELAVRNVPGRGGPRGRGRGYGRNLRNPRNAYMRRLPPPPPNPYGTGYRLDGISTEVNRALEPEPEEEDLPDQYHDLEQDIVNSGFDVDERTHRTPVDEGQYDQNPRDNYRLTGPDTTQINPPSDSSNNEIECAICAETLPPDSFPPSSKITANCEDHPYKACISCIQHSIQSTLDEGSIHRLICLFCHHRLSADEVEKYATKSALTRYKYLMLLDSPDIIMCLSPTCKSGQKHVDKQNPKMVCNTCSFATCVLHKLPWHDNVTCAEFDTSEEQIERLEEAEATAKLLAKEQSQICPECHQGVFRSEGCDHMIDTFTNLLHGAPASETLLKARDQKNERVRTEIRGNALLAIEKRMADMKAAAEKRSHEEKMKNGGMGVNGEGSRKRKPNLKPAWEEGGLKKKALP